MHRAAREMNNADSKTVMSLIGDPLKPDASALLDLARDKSSEGREKLTRVIGDLLQHGLDTGAEEVATDLLLNLLERAELDLREALAQRFAVMDNAPLRLVLSLSHDTIRVARPVLMHSKILTDIDLEYIIRASTSEYWRAIAMRPQISEKIVDCLVGTGDIDTALTVLENEHAPISDKSMRRLVNSARSEERLHHPLLQRPEMSPELASELYWFVSRELRNQIVGQYDVNPDTLDQMLESIVKDFVDSATGTINITDEMRKVARQFALRGQLTPAHLLQTLRRGQMSFFVAMLAEYASISTDMVRRLIQRDAIRTFAVLARAIGIQKSDFATMFLLSRGARLDDKIVHPDELARAMRVYDRFSEEEAAAALERWGIRRVRGR